MAGPAGGREIGLRLARLVIGTALAEEVLHRGVPPAVWARLRTDSVLPPAAGHLAGNITGLGAVTAS